VISVTAKGNLMKRNIWLFLLSPLLVLTGVPANAGILNLTDMLSAGTCVAAPDPNTPGLESGAPAGCWTLQNQNSDNTSGGVGQTAADGNGSLLNGLTVTGSDVNTVDSFLDPFPGMPNGGALFNSSTGPCSTQPDPNTNAPGFPAGCGPGLDPALLGVDGSGDGLSQPGIDPYGTPFSTTTFFTTVITGNNPGLTDQGDGITYAGDLSFTWTFTTLDAGSFYDQAGYYVCFGGFSGSCSTTELTMNFDSLANGFQGASLNPDGSLNTGPCTTPPDPTTDTPGIPAGCSDPSTFPAQGTGNLETGTATVFGLTAGDIFGAYVLSLDNANGAGTITFAGPAATVTPEPASFLLIGGGLLVLGGAWRKKHGRRGAGQ
jgi:hypothetical protein